MKLHYFEYKLEIVSAGNATVNILITHPSGRNHSFYIYPSASGWRQPAIWSPELHMLLQESRISEASDLYHLFKKIVNINAQEIIGEKQ